MRTVQEVIDQLPDSKDLVPILKTESIVSAILHRQQKLTVEHIEKLAVFFHVSPSVFFENPNAKKASVTD